MDTLIQPFDYDALVAPIEQAADSRTRHSAVWDALRDIRGEYNHWNRVAAIDAAAWAAGVSARFRANAVRAMLDSAVWDFPEDDRYPVIPDDVLISAR
jgi:hypothetical protein